MTQHAPNRLTIHHTATVQNPARTIEEKMFGLQAFSQRDDSLAGGKKKPAWADVPYHYYVAVDGAVAEGREWRYVGDTNTEYNPAGPVSGTTSVQKTPANPGVYLILLYLLGVLYRFAVLSRKGRLVAVVDVTVMSPLAVMV